MSISKFKISVDASERGFRIIPVFEVYGKKDDALMKQEYLQNFREEVCREILFQNYSFQINKPLYGAFNIKVEDFYLFKEYVKFEPDFENNIYQLSFDNIEFIE